MTSTKVVKTSVSVITNNSSQDYIPGGWGAPYSGLYRGGGTGGWDTGRKGGGRCTGDGRRGDGKRDSQGGGKREKKGKIMQHCTIFHNRKNAKGREPKNTGRELGLKGTGNGRFKPPLSPSHYTGQLHPKGVPFISSQHTKG